MRGFCRELRRRSFVRFLDHDRAAVAAKRARAAARLVDDGKLRFQKKRTAGLVEPFTGIHRAPEKLGRLGFGDHRKLSLQLGGLMLSATKRESATPRRIWGKVTPPVGTKQVN